MMEFDRKELMLIKASLCDVLHKLCLEDDRKKCLLLISKISKELCSDVSVDFDRVRDIWNRKTGGILPKVSCINTERKRKVEARFREFRKFFKDIDDVYIMLEIVLDAVLKNDFYCGRTKNKYKATFDFIFKNETNWLKSLENTTVKEQSRVGDAVNRINDIFGYEIQREDIKGNAIRSADNGGY